MICWTSILSSVEGSVDLGRDCPPQIASNRKRKDLYPENLCSCQVFLRSRSTQGRSDPEMDLCCWSRALSQLYCCMQCLQYFVFLAWWRSRQQNKSVQGAADLLVDLYLACCSVAFEWQRFLRSPGHCGSILAGALPDP